MAETRMPPTGSARISARSALGAIFVFVGMLLMSPALPRAAGGAGSAPGSPLPAPVPDPEPGTSRGGERFFNNRSTGPGKIACADCHLITPPGFGPPDDLIRAGHNLFDAFGRGTWWNGRITTDSGEAAEVCHQRFQGGTELDARIRLGLVLYMKGQPAPVSNPIVILKVAPGRTPVNEGDAARGNDLFRRACAVCHAAGGPGAGGDLAASTKTPKEIADLIRTGEGRMPLFQSDVL